MEEQSVGAARVDLVVNTDTMQPGIAAAKRTIAGIGAEAAKQFDQMDAASKRQAESWKRQIDLAGKTRLEQIAYNAEMRIGGQLGKELAAQALKQQEALNATAKAASGVSAGIGNGYKSTKELAFALRTLPAQFTDIAVSLQAGQRPLTVLLQQGGQLKDMFGGIGPAAKAMGGYLLGLLTPLNLTVAAIGGLSIAAFKAAEDQKALSQALIVTGNYANKTVGQMNAAAESIASTANISQGLAREAVQKVAESGRFTGEQFDQVAQAAARMSEATGQSLDTIISKFTDLGKAPLDTLVKLNETEHFLTQAQYERVKALQDEGRQQDAATEAARIYANRLNDVAAAADAARPHLASMWAEAKKGASDAWEETKNFSEFLAAAAEKSRQQPFYERFNIFGAFQALRQAEPTVAAAPQRVRGAVDSTKLEQQAKAEKEAAQFKDQFLTKEEQKKRDIARLDQLRAQYTAQEYANLRKQIELRYADKPSRKADVLSEQIGIDQRASLTKTINEEISGYAKEAAAKAKATVTANEYRRSLADSLKTRKEEIDLQVAAIGLGAKEAEQKKALIQIDDEYNRKRAQLERLQRNSASAIDKEGYQKQLDDLKAYHDAEVALAKDGFKRQDAAQADWLNGAKAAYQDYVDQAANVAGQTYDLFTNAFTGMGDALANFVTTGKLDFKGLVTSILSDLAKMEARILASQVLQSILGSFLGGSSGNAFAGGGANYSANSGGLGAYNVSGYAKGDVFADSSSLSAYSGSVVNKPTMFAFARGAGVMGEAGPEAIMPLKRGPDGKLGVQMNGAASSSPISIVTNLYVDNGGAASSSTKSSGDDKAARQFADQINGMIQQKLIKEMRPGGLFWKQRNGVGA